MPVDVVPGGPDDDVYDPTCDGLDPCLFLMWPSLHGSTGQRRWECKAPKWLDFTREETESEMRAQEQFFDGYEEDEGELQQRSCTL